jgi:hypothetical protein
MKLVIWMLGMGLTLGVQFALADVARADDGLCVEDPAESILAPQVSLDAAAEATDDAPRPAPAGDRLLCAFSGDPRCSLEEGAPHSRPELRSGAIKAFVIPVRLRSRRTLETLAEPLVRFLAPSDGVVARLDRPPRR